MEEHKIGGVIGHRPSGFPWDYNDKECAAHKRYLEEMERLLTEYVTERGYDYFISSGYIGVDMDFAEIVLQLKKTKFPHIQLELAPLDSTQGMDWSETDRKRYVRLIQYADVITVPSTSRSWRAKREKRLYVASKVDAAFVFWNCKKKSSTYKVIAYLDKEKREYELVALRSFTDETRAIEEFLWTVVGGGGENGRTREKKE